MVTDYLSSLYVFIEAGLRTGFAIGVGFFAALWIPKRLRLLLRLEPDWRSNEVSTAITYFVIGALILSIFYSLVDTSLFLHSEG